MKLGLVAQNPIESVMKRLNVIPAPLLETQMAYTLSRLIMVATKLGVFDLLAAGGCRGHGSPRNATPAGSEPKSCCSLWPAPDTSTPPMATTR